MLPLPKAQSYTQMKGDNIALMPPAISNPQPGNDPNLNTCRVANSIKCNAEGFNRWNLMSKDIPQYSDYYAVNHGTTRYDPSAGLRVSQRRPYLEFEYFDSGCTSPYCLTKNECPNGETTGLTPNENVLFKNMFSSWDMDIGNKTGSRSCIGIKRDTYNSYSGWDTNSNGIKVWEQNAEMKEGPAVCGMRRQ